MATRQTPLYMVIPPRAGVLSSISGVWRVAKLTILPTVTPTPLGRLAGGLPGQPTQIINSIKMVGVS